MKIIDERLYNWSNAIRLIRNYAAHGDEIDIKITRENLEDLSIFIQVIIEYIYDLTKRYEEFISRPENKKIKSVKSII